MKRAPKRVWLVEHAGWTTSYELSERAARRVVELCHDGEGCWDRHKCRLLGEYVRVERKEKKG